MHGPGTTGLVKVALERTQAPLAGRRLGLGLRLGLWLVLFLGLWLGFWLGVRIRDLGRGPGKLQANAI